MVCSDIIKGSILRGLGAWNMADKITLMIENISELISFILKFLNTEIVSSFIGALVTIFGVWLTIRHEREMRIIEREDEIKPAFSIHYLSIEDFKFDTGNKFKQKTLKNQFGFIIAPILSTGFLFEKTLVGYLPGYEMNNNILQEDKLLFLIQVDGNYPITDIDLMSINAVSTSDDEFIQSNRIMSVGMQPPHTNSAFDLYHKHKPSNFGRIDSMDSRMVSVDTNTLNKYISPDNEVILEVPINKGYIDLKRLIFFINNDPEFMKEEHFIDWHYPFNSANGLYYYLYNFNNFPMQISFEFELKDIDNNTHIYNVQCFASLLIEQMENNDNFLIIPTITTNAIYPNIQMNINYEDLRETIDNEYQRYNKN